MMLSSLPDFIKQIESSGELHTVEARVSARLELAAITRRVCSLPEGGHALLFLKPDQYAFPVTTNLFGSRHRMNLALGLDNLNDLTKRFEELLQGAGSDNYKQLSAALGQSLTEHSPTVVSTGPCLDQLEPAADLLHLPFPQGWPDDGSAAGTGCYITLGQVFTADPDGSDANCGIYRCQIHDSRTLAIRWRRGSGAENHYSQFAQQGKPMPLAITLGGPPALTLASAWPLPEGLSEVVFAGWLMGSSIPVVNCSHGPLQVPAESEFVIEGFAEPDQYLIEGPFGNHTGRYDPAGPAVKVTITRITRRNDPILPVTVVGPPPQEDCWMMLGWERLLAAFLRKMVPGGVQDICVPLPWVFHQSAIISFADPTPGKVRELVQALWQLPWFAKARLIVVVDSSVKPADVGTVAWRMINETGWRDDLIYDDNGLRLAIDATGRNFRAGLEDSETDRLIEERWKEYGLV